MNITTIGSVAVKVFGKAKFKLAQKSPYIATAVGVVGVVTGVVLACKATLKVEEVMSINEEEIRVVEESHEDKTTENYISDVRNAKIHAAGRLIKLYALPVAVEGVSLALIVGGTYILHRRVVAAVAAFEGVSEAYKNYRKNVIEDLGEEADTRYRLGLKKDDILSNEKTLDVNGEETEQTVKRIEKDISDVQMPSQYARYFDARNPYYSTDPSLNKLFLLGRQREANHLLKVRGFVFLNDIYRMLGMPCSPEGQIVGWVKDNENGDGMISFDIFEGSNPENRDFVNGFSNGVLLDFNVDGNIYQYLKKDGKMHLKEDVA